MQAILFAALEADIGIAVATNNPRRLQAYLGTFRNKQQQKGLRIYDCLTFRCPAAHAGELWILKKAKVEEPADAS